MAETVKKSRIVSEENYSSFDVLPEDSDSLQDIINTEFNERLKNCMTPNLTLLNEPPDLPNTNGFHSKLIDATQEFLNNEIENKEVPSPETPSPENELTPPFEHITVTDVDNENLTAKERFLSTISDEETDKQTVKDRMFLSTDSACLLFTQTVVQSPMLTPTDENYDFLQALRTNPETPENPANISPPEPKVEAEIEAEAEPKVEAEAEAEVEVTSSNSENDLSDSQQIQEIKEDLQEFVKENLIEAQQEDFKHILQELKADVEGDLQEFVQENLTDTEEDRVENEPELVKVNLIEQELNGDVEEEDEVEDSTAVTSESTYVETRTEMSSSGEKCLKKKKSKKAKKDSEKENISVSDLTNNCEILEETLSHVSVKNLRAKSMSDIRREDVNLDNVFSNVSVKYLRECFDNLTNKHTNNNNVSLQTQTQTQINIKPSITTSDRIKQLKSSFSKFDALAKKTVLHVRSSDAGKAQEKFNGNNQIDSSSCKSCQKQVFQMEQIKAEKAIWHKNCFRCQECNKQLNVDTYQSNEGVLYCKPHFKALFTPKAVEDEPQPTSDKPDLGLEELQNLNVKERFQVFENHENSENSLERTSSTVNVKRSPSILSKLAKFQQKGMDIGVGDDSLNGVPLEESSSEPEEEDDEIDGSEDPNLIRARRAAAQREIPLHFNNMSEVMSKWESGNQMTKEERREERKQEIQSIRSRLFMGKQGKMKEMYQQAVAESESGVNVKKSVLDTTELCEGAKSLKDKFERGEALTHDEEQKLRELEEDKGVFETGISKKSRSIFLELDANASKAPQLAPLSPSKSGTEVRRARELPSPERDVYRDPDIIRSDDLNEDDSLLAKKTHTATKMLNIFRQMEENLQKKEEPLGPKPLKRFTPPPEGESQRNESGSEEDVTESEDEYEEDEDVKAVDEDLIEAQKAARAKHLRAKFEKWEAHEIQREQNNSSVNLAQEIGEGDSQIESARSLRARFESMRETTTEKERQPRVKVNRFV